MLSDPTREIHRTSLAGYKFDGYVIDNNSQNNTNSPQGVGFVKIRVPGVHRNWTDDQLPWARPHFDPGPTGAANGMGSLYIPAKFSQISIEFLDDEGHYPIYDASPKNNSVQIPGLSDDPKYPNIYGFIDAMGTFFKVVYDSSTQTIAWTHPSGAGFSLDKDGNLTINCNKLIFNILDVGTIAAKKNLILSSQQIAQLTGAQTQITGNPITNNNPSNSPTVPPALQPRMPPNLPDMSNQTNL